MKKYFAKWLPVEGKIDTTSEQHHFFDDKGILHQMNRAHAYKYEKSWKLAKLFLCSHDIQIGDKVHYFDETFICSDINHYTPEKDDNWADFDDLLDKNGTVICSNEDGYKIIGEVSPEATWVKEGDEFDLEELSFTYKPLDTIEQGVVKIKDQYGDFH